jgi:hypothetical protein
MKVFHSSKLKNSVFTIQSSHLKWKSSLIFALLTQLYYTGIQDTLNEEESIMAAIQTNANFQILMANLLDPNNPNSEFSKGLRLIEAKSVYLDEFLEALGLQVQRGTEMLALAASSGASQLKLFKALQERLTTADEEAEAAKDSSASHTGSTSSGLEHSKHPTKQPPTDVAVNLPGPDVLREIGKALQVSMPQNTQEITELLGLDNEDAKNTKTAETVLNITQSLKGNPAALGTLALACTLAENADQADQDTFKKDNTEENATDPEHVKALKGRNAEQFDPDQIRLANKLRIGLTLHFAAQRVQKMDSQDFTFSPADCVKNDSALSLDASGHRPLATLLQKIAPEQTLNMLQDAANTALEQRSAALAMQDLSSTTSAPSPFSTTPRPGGRGNYT